MAKVMIVDDSDTQRFQMRQDLEKGGHQVIEACDGADGLDKLQQNPDLQVIVCDVNMPNMDGLTMCSKIQALGTFKAVSIFMLTTEASTEVRDSARNFGVRAFIRKPYVAEKLLAAIKKVAA